MSIDSRWKSKKHAGGNLHSHPSLEVGQPGLFFVFEKPCRTQKALICGSVAALSCQQKMQLTKDKYEAKAKGKILEILMRD